jgi:hypothetical protein
MNLKSGKATTVYHQVSTLTVFVGSLKLFLISTPHILYFKIKIFYLKFLWQDHSIWKRTVNIIASGLTSRS